MDMTKIKPFYYAAKAGSFSRTELNLSSSVISRHVADLEGYYGAKLFYRTQKGLVLTKVGEVLFDRVKFILSYLEETEKNLLQESGEDIREELNVVIPFQWGGRLMAPYLTSFIQKFSNMGLNIVADGSSNDQVEKALTSVDTSAVTVAILPYAPKEPSLIKKHLFSLDLKLYASTDYIAECGEPKSIADLDQHKFVAFSQAKNQSFADLDWHLKLGRKDGDPRRPALRMSDPIYTATEGKGVGILTLGDKNILLKDQKIVNILPEVKGPTINVYYAYSEHLKGVKAVKIFSDFLKDLLMKEFNQGKT